MLARIVSDKDEGMKILLDHPETKDRISAINAVATAGVTTPLLDAADWSALKQICASRAADGTAAKTGQAAKADDHGAPPQR